MDWRAWIPQAWNASQRGVLVGFVAVLLLVICIRYARNPVYISDPQPDHPPRFVELADRVDPNTADWPTLAALPGLGPKRAQDIVAYREQFLHENPGVIAFTRPEDLMRVRGIGVSIMTLLTPYLVFPPAEAVDGVE